MRARLRARLRVWVGSHLDDADVRGQQLVAGLGLGAAEGVGEHLEHLRCSRVRVRVRVRVRYI